MLDPSPARPKFAAPAKILSKEKLREAWKCSRDSTKNAGRPGIDGITAEKFAFNFDQNVSEIITSLRRDQYKFSHLKAVFIPKPNSAKERMICIPTVRDRLVQRTIVDYLVTKKKFPIYNSSSFGFIRDKGPAKAIIEAMKFRESYDWCLKTDIESFFDNIPRAYLKRRISVALKIGSLVPILHRVVDCEVAYSFRQQAQIRKQGIKLGHGVRQGMPLSPIFANLVLAEFDKEIFDLNIKMIRYADDLLLFFKDKADAKAGKLIVKSLLQKLQLSIPDIYDGSKTEIIAPKQPLDFLGRELVYLDSENSHVARISQKQIDKIKNRLADDYTFAQQIQKGAIFQKTVVDLSRSISAYRAIYSDAHNFSQLSDDLRGLGKQILQNIFLEIFEPAVLKKLDDKARLFLGLGPIKLPEPINDLDL